MIQAINFYTQNHFFKKPKHLIFLHKMYIFEQKSVKLINSRSLANPMTEKHFKQPSGEFTIHDIGYPRVEPDTSTPVRKAMVAFEDKIRRDTEFETGAFFDEHGNMLLKRTGLPNQVRYTHSELMRMRGKCFSHNHPNGGSFSIDDIQQAAQYQCAELRAVSPHYRHILTPKNHWIDILYDEIEEVAEVYQSIVEERVRKEIEAKKFDARFYSNEVTHRLWTGLAKRYNFHYKREPS